MHNDGEYAALDKSAISELDHCKENAIQTVSDIGEVPVIETDSDAAAWHLTLGELRDRKKLAIEVIERIRRPAYDAYQAVLAFKKDIIGPLEAVEKQIAGRLSEYKREKDRRDREERDRILREIEEEQKRQQEAEAKLLEAEGDTAAAEAIRKAPVVIRPDAFETSLRDEPVEYSDRYRDNWKAEVVDLPQLVQAVADGKLPLSVIEPNMKELNQLARALKDAARIPGVIVRNDPVPLTGRW